ncbi:MAG: hypothetical protein E6Q35_08295 [Chryseobacterium cucumeris]|nr:MAG: hypothetical protein E6Q35_08295 [Chryseobacterium cucumeris]
MITEKEFSENLEKIFNGENPMSFLEKKYDVLESYQTFNSLMIEAENLYNPVFENTINKFLTSGERFKMFQDYKLRYYKKVFKENKILFLKTLYYQLTGKI